MSIVAVAKRAGVSIATVSRVINDMHNVRPETVEQVRAAIAETGYKPPQNRRWPGGRPRPRNGSVRSAFRTGQFAVLTLGAFQQWLGLPVMASVVSGIMKAAQELELRAVLDQMPEPDVLSTLLRRREVDGALVFFTGGIPLSKLTELRQRLPLVWVMGGEGGPVDVDHVSADNMGIGQLAHQYLAGQGCERVAFIADDPGWQIMRLRAMSFASSAIEARHEYTPFVVGSGQLLEPYGRKVRWAPTLEKLVQRLAESEPDTRTGLFIPTDLLATRIYPLLVQHGIQPGRDLHVISCDNESERLGQLTPRPPSIDIRGEEIGRCAVRRLFHRLQRPDDAALRLQIAPSLALPPVSGADRR